MIAAGIDDPFEFIDVLLDAFQAALECIKVAGQIRLLFAFCGILNP